MRIVYPGGGRWDGRPMSRGHQWDGGDQRNGWCMGANWGTNEIEDRWVGGPVRWGTNEMGAQWDGGPFWWADDGTNEKGDQWDGGPLRLGTNEMGDQWDGGPMSSKSVLGDQWEGDQREGGPMRGGTSERIPHFDGASIMTGERHSASLLYVIAFLLSNPDVGLPANWMLLWVGSSDLPQGSITSRCTPHEDSFKKDMPTNKMIRWVYVLQFVNKCFSPDRRSDLICNEPRFPIPSNSLAPETKVHGTIILTQNTPNSNSNSFIVSCTRSTLRNTYNKGITTNAPRATYYIHNKHNDMQHIIIQKPVVVNNEMGKLDWFPIDVHRPSIDVQPSNNACTSNGATPDLMTVAMCGAQCFWSTTVSGPNDP